MTGSMRGALASIEKFSTRTVVVVGDLITDEYLFGKPVRISREAPVLILSFSEREVLLGGAEIIADGINGSVVDPLDSRAVTAALERFRQRREDEVAAAARGSAEPYTYAAQVDGFARIYSRSTRATCDFS